MTQPLPPSFLSKKKRILEQLAVPVGQYDDLSPKGSVDEAIRDLIDEINGIEKCVTTSSCAGRISVFLEGKKAASSGSRYNEEEGKEVEDKLAGVGGKGGGGRWLFVSHDPVLVGKDSQNWIEILGMQNIRHDEEAVFRLGVSDETRFIHFKFEPMILHILTSSLSQAQAVLSAAIQAGFRESGALNLTPSSQEEATPMVGIRSMGLSLESVIGYEKDGKEYCMIPQWQLRNLIEISNQRFKENTKRIERFRILLKDTSIQCQEAPKKKGQDGEEWEDAEARRERKRTEGLERAQMKKNDRAQATESLHDAGLPFIGTWHTE